ncbi:MAG TPA: hypothetical protein VGC27_00470 [Rhizomicrobium sp.]
MKEKHRALLMLALVSFSLPLGEMVVLHRPAPRWSTLSFAEAFLTAYAIYWWYVTDKRERSFTAGRVQDFGVILATIIALPVYFVRSRGWWRGALAILGALAIIILVGLLALVGGRIGAAIAF